MDIKLVSKEDYDKIYTFVEEAFKNCGSKRRNRAGFCFGAT